MKTYTFRRIGVIAKDGRGVWRKVKWEDGSEESFTFETLKSLKKGDRFESMVTYNYFGSRKCVNITEVKQIEHFKISPEKSKALWDRIMTKHIPVSWDEIL